MTEKSAMSDQQTRDGFGDVMLVPVDDDEEQGGNVLTEAEARAFMERPIRAQREAESA